MTTGEMKGITEVADAESRAFLARKHIGRIAFSLHDRISIEPISYTFDGGWILGRTSVGTKLATLAHHPWCAFEVDEITSPVEWTSVVVRGSFYLLDPESGTPGVYAKALASVRALTPDAFSPYDPAPHRGILFGIYANEITGRRARTH